MSNEVLLSEIERLKQDLLQMTARYNHERRLCNQLAEEVRRIRGGE